MNVRKLSVNKACIFFAVLLLVAMGTVSAALYGLTQNITAVWYVLLFGIFVLVCAVCFMVLVRRKLAMFSDAFCSLMDDMLSGNMQPKQTVEEESLFYIPIYSAFRRMVPYAAFHYPVISLLVVAAIVLLVCLATPVITFMQNVKQSVVERLRQN